MSLETWALTSLHEVLQFLSHLSHARLSRVSVGPNVTPISGWPPNPQPSQQEEREGAWFALLRELNRTAGCLLDAVQIPPKTVRMLGYGSEYCYQSVLVAVSLKPGQSVEATLELPESRATSLDISWQIEGPLDAVAKFPDWHEGDGRSLTGLATVGMVRLEPKTPRKVIISRLAIGQAPRRFDFEGQQKQ